MSIVSSIRDYVEFLNSLSASLGSDDVNKIIVESFFYFLKTLQYSVFYILSFQWLRDFALLPIIIPQISQAIFKETFFIENPGKVFFDFLEIPSLDQNKFLLGFFNSFFLTLPLTVTHIITVRRLIIQGIPAALSSFLGFLLGQTLFILCVTFGVRSILIPWLSLEPLNYIFGIFLIFQVVYSMVNENLTPLPFEKPDSFKEFFKVNIPLQKFFLVNFILSWCEQGCIFQFFSNLTLSGQSSILEGFSTKTTFASFFGHTNYIFGIFIGSIVFAILWAFFILQVKNLLLNVLSFSFSRFLQIFNQATFVVVVAFTLTSIPFYGFDYLIAGPLGFVSQDSFFKNTVFDQTKLKNPLYKEGFYLDYQQFSDYDVSVFDRGRYLIYPEIDEVYYSFEDLNYRGELEWNQRDERLSRFEDSEKDFFGIKNFYKKQKTQPFTKSTNKSIEFTTYEDSNSLPEKENSILKEKESRFENWYKFQSDVSSSLEETEDEIIVNEIKKTFEDFNLLSFSNQFFQHEDIPQLYLEKIIKQKYYSNPLYKNLLALDIDLFLNRQPTSSFLTKNQESDLYEKRLALTSYYDSLRFYEQFPSSEPFENFFNGTKSFTNKIYNQQFKGTLKTVQRLFCLNYKDSDFVSQETLNNPSVLKFDQPLYEKSANFSSYHEEIPEIEVFTQKNQSSSLTSNKTSTNFLKEIISKPLYAGWDENLRKFVITNKFLPRSFAGFETKLPQDFRTNFVLDPKSKKKSLKSQKIKFTVWPKPQDFNQKDVPFYVLYTKNFGTFFDDYDQLKEKNVYNSLPKNLEIVQAIIEQDPNKQLKKLLNLDSMYGNLVPKRGGFIWPGNSILNFEKFKLH